MSAPGGRDARRAGTAEDAAAAATRRLLVRHGDALGAYGNINEIFSAYKEKSLNYLFKPRLKTKGWVSVVGMFFKQPAAGPQWALGDQPHMRKKKAQKACSNAEKTNAEKTRERLYKPL